MPLAPMRCLLTQPPPIGAQLHGRPFALSHQKLPRRTGIVRGVMVAHDFGVRLETMSRSWNGPLRFFFSLALPAANFVALYSDVLVASVPLFPEASAILQPILALSGLIFPFVILPILDRISGRDMVDPPPDVAHDPRYRNPVYLYIPVQLMLLFCACQRASYLALNPIHFLGVTLGLGTCGGLGFTVAHELIHGTSKFEAFLVDVLLCLFCYMHYSASHIAHHIKVGTKDDAGTGRFKESFYAFFPRAIYMSVRDGLWMERKRLKAHHRSLLSHHNKMWMWFVAPLALFSSVHVFFGTAALMLMCSQAFLAIASLELVNYIEHYGLTRQTVDGTLEAVTSKHSWNADWGWTSALVFNLQRHAHHHIQSTMPYQGLKSLKDAPMLPLSYPGMMLTALIPPLYFRLMHPLLNKHQRLQ